MAKRRIKKKNVFLAILTLIFIIGVCILCVLFVTSDKEVPVENSKKEKEEEKIQEPKEKRMSLVAV